MKAIVLAALAGCCPGWNLAATVRDPSNRRVDNAVVTVACPDGRWQRDVRYTDPHGIAGLGDLGSFPEHCDLYIAKPGFRTIKIAYADICTKPKGCYGDFTFDLILEPEVMP